MLKRQTVLFVDQFRGINQSTSPDKIGDGEFVLLQNWHTFLGDLVTRPGSVTFATGLGGTIQKLYDYRRQDQNSVTRFLISEVNGEVFSVVNGARGATIQTGLRNDRAVALATLNGVVLGSDGDAPMFRWDGIATQAVDGPKTRILKTFVNHAFAGGIRDLPNSVRYSNKSDGTLWDGEDEIDIDAGDGDILQAMGTPGPYLSLHQSKAIWIVSGASRQSFAADQVDVGKEVEGAVGPEAIITINRVDYFLGRTSFWAFNGSGRQDLGDAISRAIIQTLNPARLPYAKVQYFPKYKEILVACSSGTSNTNDIVLVLNLKTLGWSLYTGIAAEAMLLLEGENQEFQMLTGDYSGNILRQDVGETDNGEPIEAIIESKGHAVDNPALIKRHRSLLLYFHALKTTTPTLEYWFDQDETKTRTVTNVPCGTPTSVWDEAFWDIDSWDGVDLVRSIFPLRGAGRTFHWRLTTSNPMALQRYALEAMSRGIR